MPTTMDCSTRTWGVSTADFTTALNSFQQVITTTTNTVPTSTLFIDSITSTNPTITYNPLPAYVITAGKMPEKIRRICHCNYCGTAYDDDEEFVSNCKNCGAIIRR